MESVQTWWCFQELPRWSTHSAGCAHMEKDSRGTGFGRRALPWWFHRTQLETTATHIGWYIWGKERNKQHKLALKIQLAKYRGEMLRKADLICSLRQLFWIIEMAFRRSDTTHFHHPVSWKEKEKWIQYSACLNIRDTAWISCRTRWQILQSKVETRWRRLTDEGRILTSIAIFSRRKNV